MASNMFPVRAGLLTGVAAIGAAFLMFPAKETKAAASEGCEGGGYTIILANGMRIGPGDTTVPAASLGTSFLVRGRYTAFTVVSNSFAVRNQLFTGAPNALDITGGRRTIVFSSKTPNHRGLVLSGPMQVSIAEEGLEISRESSALSMKIQAKDCAQGGIFQMEPERGDNGRTTITHVLAPGVFYFDNPNFRAREGDTVPFKDTTVVVSDRINIANDFSRKFVLRDSSQSADRIDEPRCRNLIPTRTGDLADVLHCGGISRWTVASGGRMGFVTGEDAIEVAPPTPDCTRQCRNQTQVRGESVKLGFPFPVPDNVRLKPRTP